MALFAGSRKVEALEAEVASLRQWVDRLNGMDAVQLEHLMAQARTELDGAQGELARVRGEVAHAHGELIQARQEIVEAHEEAILQEVGIYAYRHPLDSAVAYRQRLDETRAMIKSLATADRAVNASTSWTVNDSKATGQKMVKDLKKLMLRAYNAEADNAVRSLKPHALPRAVERLSKVRETIARLGALMSIRVSDEYHRLRVYELELTADYLSKVEEEKERVRAERERQREEAKALREFEAAKTRLRKEQAHYQAALARAIASGDEAAAATLRSKLAEIGGQIAAVEAREANTRAGYVYVISNIGAFGERMVKVGMTRRLDSMDRVRELGDASVPFRFDTHALIFAEDAVGLEARLHRELADRRVNQVNTRREFFYASPTEVRAVLSHIAGSDLLLEFNEIAEALEWRASGAHLIPTQPPAGGESVTPAARQLLAEKAQRGLPVSLSSADEDDVEDALDALEDMPSAAGDPSDAGEASTTDDDELDLLARGGDEDERQDPVRPGASAHRVSFTAEHPGSLPAATTTSDRLPLRQDSTGDSEQPRRAPAHVAHPSVSSQQAVEPASIDRRSAPATAQTAASQASTPAAGGPSQAAQTSAASSGSVGPAVTPAAAPSVGPGWYADPWRQARLRWWDGSTWTHHVTP